MSKIVRLTESDLVRLVKRIINEQGAILPKYQPQKETTGIKDKSMQISFFDNPQETNKVGTYNVGYEGSDGNFLRFSLNKGMMGGGSGTALYDRTKPNGGFKIEIGSAPMGPNYPKKEPKKFIGYSRMLVGLINKNGL